MTDNEQYSIVHEHYHEFENLPVCVCILETPAGFFFVGHSATARHRYASEIAQALARRDAMRNLTRFRDRRPL